VTIGWQHPAALWALPLAAAPIIIHLLRMHRADRVLFPSLRFVRHSHTAAVRLQHPSEWWLIVLRMSALALAIAALAGPIVVSPSRVAGWNLATARAVVVDVSDSMNVAAPDGRAPAGLAAEAADAERKTSTCVRQIDTRDLAAGVARARAWLESAPPARKEIVVISDFQRGALNEAEDGRGPAVLALPDTVGLRLVAVGRPTDRQMVPGVDLLGAGAVGGRAQIIGLSRETTELTIAPAVTRESTGLRILSRSDPGVILRTVAAAGAPAGSPEEPILIRFAEAEAPGPPAGVEPVRAAWMLRALLRFQNDQEMRAAAASVQSAGPLTGSLERPTGPWFVAAGDARGKPLVTAAAVGRELVLDVAASPESLFAATVVRGILTSRRSTADYAEREIARIDQATLAASNRPPPPVDVPDGPAARAFWRSVDATDARWCWIAVLAVLGVEQWLRARRRSPEADAEVDRAAA
jgi:Aerotolerance regulator N-terminal